MKPARDISAVILLAAILLIGTPTRGDEPAAKFEVYPTDIHLNTARGEQSIVCRVVLKYRRRSDSTARCFARS